MTGAPVPVVLLHGFTDSAACWPTVLPRYTAAGRRVVALDARGHGGRPLPDEPFTVAALAADAAEELRALGLGPALVVAHSMGGLTAEELALSAPDLVAGLVLEDPAWLDEAARAEASDSGNRPLWLAPLIEAAAGRTIEEIAAGGRRDNPHWSEPEILGWAEATRGLDPRLVEVPHDWTAREWVSALADVRVPVTLLTGDPGSAIVTDDQVARARDALGTAPDGLLTHVPVPGAGHCIRRDAPEAYLAALDAALARADAAATG